MESTPTFRTYDELLTVHQVARRLRVHDTTVRRWIKIGALEAVELPRVGPNSKHRIKPEILDQLLNNPPE